ncbi:MAG: 23S rRNA (pseudouridine(1915)-N(3))-methyltransferase RlmH [Candidatus Puniceispirillaceae bacterium]
METSCRRCAPHGRGAAPVAPLPGQYPPCRLRPAWPGHLVRSDGKTAGALARHRHGIRLQRHRDDGAGTIYFAIGGADGHDRRVLDRAQARIAFGSATWPHMLFRAMLAEQLYRATMILAGHPYHRGN